MAKRNIPCYLCGKLIENEADYDHVPPRQFYAKLIRKKRNPNLFVLPVHSLCNKSYQLDEDYFVHSMAPLTIGSFSGNAIWEDLKNQYKTDFGYRLLTKVFKELEKTPSGIFLPYGKVAKRFDPARIWRVVWKIVRGLFYKENKIFLPENTPRINKIYSVGEKPDPEFPLVRDTASKGQYPGVFDYKYISFQELDNFHYWALLFWDRLIVTVGFHDPKCKCGSCKRHILKS